MVPLGREVFLAVMQRQHRLAASRGVTMKQIAREPLVSLTHDSRTRRTIDAAASKQGITLQHAVTVTQLATVMSFVRAGLGVAIDRHMIARAAQRFVAPLATRPLFVVHCR
jgi:DNA-binding transcriptional LysR family regulator